jgi:CheY-like chemotaxis protein
MESEQTNLRPARILLVEDSPGDIRLTEEALHESRVKVDLVAVKNGEDALAYLYREAGYEDAPRPDLILLDLNMPKTDGREVLARIKEDADLRRIPVVILTTSRTQEDVARSYEHQANCYISKPINLDKFIEVIQAVNDFWLTVVSLPPEGKNP